MPRRYAISVADLRLWLLFTTRPYRRTAGGHRSYTTTGDTIVDLERRNEDTYRIDIGRELRCPRCGNYAGDGIPRARA